MRFISAGSVRKTATGDPQVFCAYKRQKWSRLQPTHSITKPTEMGPFGLILSFLSMEISRILDCLVRIAVVSKKISAVFPCFRRN
jgi:hypothetical protein